MDRHGPVLIGLSPVASNLGNQKTGCGPVASKLGQKTGPDRTLKHYTTAIIYSPYGGLEDDSPSVEGTEAEDNDMLMNPVSRPPPQCDTSSLVRRTGKFCLRCH